MIKYTMASLGGLGSPPSGHGETCPAATGGSVEAIQVTKGVRLQNQVCPIHLMIVEGVSSIEEAIDFRVLIDIIFRLFTKQLRACLSRNRCHVLPAVRSWVPTKRTASFGREPKPFL